MMRYATMCSGIEACSVAWHPLGWEPVFYSEVASFPCAVLDYHYPTVPNIGDMMEIQGEQYRGTVDVVCAGTPCQSFSVAGKRGGMDDDRGQLAIRFIELLEQIRPRWVVWENVPGVLSSNGGRDFGAFLARLGQCGYGFAYRVLDARHFGVPQRRRRVFVVGHSSGDWRCAAAVLFEQESLYRNTPPRPKAGQSIAGTIGGGSGSCSWCPDVAAPCSASGPPYSRPGNERSECDAYVAHLAPTLKGQGKGSGRAEPSDGNGHGLIAFGWNKSACQTLRVGDTTDALQGSPTSNPAVMSGASVRRLTPTECERLMGFPDGYSMIPYRGKPADQCPDSPRYAALGNSMAVPVMRWIGQRIQMFHNVGTSKQPPTYSNTMQGNH